MNKQSGQTQNIQKACTYFHYMYFERREKNYSRHQRDKDNNETDKRVWAKYTLYRKIIRRIIFKTTSKVYFIFVVLLCFLPSVRMYVTYTEVFKRGKTRTNGFVETVEQNRGRGLICRAFSLVTPLSSNIHTVTRSVEHGSFCEGLVFRFYLSSVAPP